MGARLSWGFVSWVLAGVYWLADRLYGDAIFNWLRPMIPQELADPDGVIWVVTSFGPPAVLLILGAYLIVTGRSTAVDVASGHRAEEPQQPSTAYGSVVLHSAIGFRDGIVNGRLDAATKRLARGDYVGMVKKMCRETIHCPELDDADTSKLRPQQIALLSEYRSRVREFHTHVDDVTKGRYPGTDKEAATRFRHTLNMASQRLDKLINQRKEVYNAPSGMSLGAH